MRSRDGLPSTAGGDEREDDEEVRTTRRYGRSSMITCLTPTSGFRTSVDDGISCDAATLKQLVGVGRTYRVT